VFGEKKEVTKTEGSSDESTSTSSTTLNGSPQANKPTTPPKAMGPAPPGDNDFDPEEIKKAEQFKTNGNTQFADNKFDAALDAYSEAIFCNVPLKNKAIYYCNRSLVSIKLENYALALFDANDAIKCDECYFKAYYRRGSAHLAMN